MNMRTVLINIQLRQGHFLRLQHPIGHSYSCNSRLTKRQKTKYLLGDLDRVDKVHIETIAELDDSGRNLVEGDTLLAS